MYYNSYDVITEAFEILSPVLIMATIMFTIICITACAIIADRKGRSIGGWIFFGLVFPLAALIILSCLRDLNKHND